MLFIFTAVQDNGNSFKPHSLLSKTNTAKSYPEF